MRVSQRRGRGCTLTLGSWRGMRRILLLALLVASAASADDEVFVDDGACPGEGCAYGERWVAKEAMPLLAEPEEGAEVRGRLAEGEAVQTLTGQVRTTPGRYVVERAHQGFEPGDTVLLYTYLGEGIYRIRHNGTWTTGHFGFSPWGGGRTDVPCSEEDSEGCWGHRAAKERMDWWVRVRNEAGVEGWVTDPFQNFEQPGP